MLFLLAIASFTQGGSRAPSRDVSHAATPPSFSIEQGTARSTPFIGPPLTILPLIVPHPRSALQWTLYVAWSLRDRKPVRAFS